jgi:hypothetical protein
MNADLRARIQYVAVGLDAIPHVVHGEPATRVGHIHTMRPGLFHDLGLLGQFRRRRHVRHHQETRHIHAQFTRLADVLDGDIRLGGVCRHPYRPHAQAVSLLQSADRSDTGQQ